jgi:hypothetical protein
MILVGDHRNYEVCYITNMSRELQFQFRFRFQFSIPWRLAHCEDILADALGACILPSEYL